jgi:Na+-driven multidrug efflux pump
MFLTPSRLLCNTVTATVVAKKHASGDKEGTQDAVSQALFLGFFIAMIGTPLMFFNPNKALSSVLKCTLELSETALFVRVRLALIISHHVSLYYFLMSIRSWCASFRLRNAVPRDPFTCLFTIHDFTGWILGLSR